MKVQIRNNAFVSTIPSVGDSKEFKTFIENNGGKWLDVDTTHLFDNQYNLIGVPFRVLDEHISAVEDDSRVGMGKCKYCGSMIREGETCTKHIECSNYSIEWFTAKNCMFIAHPKGVPAVKECKMEDEKKFGSFTLEHLSGSLNYYRLKNNRERFEFLYCNGYFYMRRGGRKAHLGIKAQSFNELELKSYLKAQNDL
jgi:hypothetical protein